MGINVGMLIFGLFDSALVFFSGVLPLDLLVKGKTHRSDFGHYFRDFGIYHLPHVIYLV